MLAFHGGLAVKETAELRTLIRSAGRERKSTEPTVWWLELSGGPHLTSTLGGHFWNANTLMCLLGQETYGDLSHAFLPGMVVSGKGTGKSSCGVQKGGGERDVVLPSRNWAGTIPSNPGACP